jgi:hypothetical protein
MKIEVLNRKPEQVQTTWEGVTKDRVKQWCLMTVDGLPTAFQITLDPGKEYDPGEYTLAPECFGVTNGRLTLNRVVLVPVAVQAKPQNKPVAA